MNRINKDTNSGQRSGLNNGGLNASKSGFQGTEVEGSTPKLERFKIRTVGNGQVVVKDDEKK